MTSEVRDLSVLRSARKADNNFIFSTWLEGLYYGNTFFRCIKKHDYYKGYQKVLERILDKSQIRILCLKEDEDVILGYAVYEAEDSPVLHWVFVKPVWRKLGIARELLPASISSVTHITKMGMSLKPAGWEFNPFLI